MREMSIILLAVAFPGLAQNAGFGPSSSPQQPPWMEVFRKVYGPQGHASPLGSLDQEVDNAWAGALAAGPSNPFFESAAQQASQYFSAQGYDRKAEIILRQAISAAGQLDVAQSRSLRLALARSLTQEQKFVAAASLIKDVLEEAKATSDQSSLTTRISAITQLAHLREQMGEIDDVEALLQEAMTLKLTLSRQAASPPPASSGRQFARVPHSGFVGLRLGSFSASHAGSSDLVSFYQRHGDPAKAETVLKKEIEEAKEPADTQRALQNYVYFLNSQQRWEESIAQSENLIGVQSASSRLEDRQMLAGSRQTLAHALATTGKPEKALEILRENVAQSSADAFQRTEALRSYAQMLVQQKQFDEAEKVVEQLRQPSGKNAAEAAKYAQPMADDLLANVRQMQNRAEDARVIRERMMAQAPKPEGVPVPVWNLLQPAQEAIQRHKYDEAFAQIQRVLVDATPRIQSNPEEIAAFANMMHQLPGGRQEERLELMRTLISVLDRVAPVDHPRIARAIGQFVGSTMQAGLGAAEVTRLLEREEKILVATKGEDSPALNDVSRQRAQFFTFRGDHAEAAAEMKRAVRRSEAASGLRSSPTLQTMRELVSTCVNNR